MVFGIVLFGLGPALAGPYSQIFDHFTINGQKNFVAIWTIQAIVAGASALAIVLFFRERAPASPSRRERESRSPTAR